MRLRRVSVLGLLAIAAAAQDARSVSSPDGAVEFRLFIDKPDAASLFRLAYQVNFHGKPLIRTSFLGLQIHNQEPALGENLGLVSANTQSGKVYNTLFAKYMQNGSLGRRLDVEVRVSNDGLAFRYFVPESTPLAEMLIDDEATEFELAAPTEAINRMAPGARVELPFVADQAGIGWVAIDEIRSGTYPRLFLTREQGNILVSRLQPRRNETDTVWEGTTPLTCPWRVLLIGTTREQVTQADLARRFNP